MTTRIPPTAYEAILQTRSSPETTAALLNEAEATYSSTPRHWNAKRLYPFWKTCQVCSQPFPCETREQAVRNLTCSPACNARRISLDKKGKRLRPPRLATCPQCGQDFEAPHGRRPAKYCSNSCRAKANAGHLTPFSANMKGRKRTDPRYGPDNPAWKGGVTYFKTHGNYQGVKYVRCRAEYLPMARKDGYVMEHRLIVAQIIGRCLLRSEVVHHKNHNPTDNAPTNLQLFASNAHHKRYEATGSPAPIWSL